MKQTIVHPDSVQQDLQALREEIKQFADTLPIFDGNNPALPPTEIIETLNGIGQGALSCAAFLKYMAVQAKPMSTKSMMERQQEQIREDASEVLRHCAELSKILRRLQRNLRNMPADEIGDLEAISLQVQAALGSITTEWEELA